MSTAAVVLLRNEADIVEPIIRHLAFNVDHVLVLDNLSDDETPEILAALVREGLPLEVRIDEVRGYFQAQKVSAAAAELWERGHQWVVPADADEVLYTVDGRRVADFLAGLARDAMYVQAPMHHHLPTALDPPEAKVPNILRRIGWRQREHGGMGKVVCRLRAGLQIHQGNHSAWAPGPGLTANGGLSIRHFPWRTPEQLVGKLRRGQEAYALTDLPSAVGEHWRQWEGKPDEAIVDWFWQWGYSADPTADETLIYDPAPLAPTVDVAGKDARDSGRFVDERQDTKTHR